MTAGQTWSSHVASHPSLHADHPLLVRSPPTSVMAPCRSVGRRSRSPSLSAVHPSPPPPKLILCSSLPSSRHVVCGDCLFSLVLRLVAGTPSAVHIPFLCAVDECGVVVSGMAKWARADAEAAAKVKSLSTSTYAHRSLEIRQT